MRMQARPSLISTYRRITAEAEIEQGIWTLRQEGMVADMFRTTAILPNLLRRFPQKPLVGASPASPTHK